MKNFFTTPVIWFIIGFLLFLFEFAVPGFILFFFAVGAWVVAVVALLTDISLNAQLVIFIGSSLLTLILFRKWIRQKFGMMHSHKPVLEDEIIGKKAKAETFIGPGKQGKVTFKGASWTATSSDSIKSGEEVTITGYDSIVLIVKSLKLP